MKYTEPEIIFSRNIIREKKFPKCLYYFIDPLCREVEGSRLFYDITPKGVATIIRYIFVEEYVILRIIRFKPDMPQLIQHYSHEEPAVCESVLRHLLFSTSTSLDEIYYKTHGGFKMFDSRIIGCHRHILPVMIRSFLELSRLEFGSHIKYELHDLSKRYPFQISQKASFCDNIYGPRDAFRMYIEARLSDFFNRDQIYELKSFTNYWIQLTRRKGIKSLNKTVIVHTP